MEMEKMVSPGETVPPHVHMHCAHMCTFVCLGHM